MPKKTKLVSLLLVATALSISGNIYAEIAPVKPGVDFVQQDGKATGTVVDAFGPVVGASVLVKGTTNGNITDLDGNFTLEGVNNGDIIVISYIGYVTQEIPFTGQPINVTLAEELWVSNALKNLWVMRCKKLGVMIWYRLANRTWQML